MRIVEKYGGTSIATQALMSKAADHIAALSRQGAQMVIVVSAQGHTTDVLEERVRGLGGSPRERDALLATGENQSAAIMAMTLLSKGVDALSLSGSQAGIFTTDTPGNGNILHIDTTRILKELELGKVVVVAGFQGINTHGDVTTLGRGGSDTTAVALAAWLKAACHIYTDVEGVYDRDPKACAGAVKYEKIGYEEMLSLIDSGAQVLHRPCVELAKQFGIPVQVASAFTRRPGTIVGL